MKSLTINTQFIKIEKTKKTKYCVAVKIKIYLTNNISIILQSKIAHAINNFIYN